jgi:hypothetical protein
MTDGVSDLPTIPRIPDVDFINGVSFTISSVE